MCDTAAASGEFQPKLRFISAITGEPPAPLLDTLFRLATYLVSDAVSACANTAVSGHVGLLVERRRHDVLLSVEHDGWSRPPAAIVERNLGWARRIAEASGGRLSRQIDWDQTVTRITLPYPGCRST